MSSAVISRVLLRDFQRSFNLTTTQMVLNGPNGTTYHTFFIRIETAVAEKAGILSCETGVNGQNSTVSSWGTVHHLSEYCWQHRTAVTSFGTQDKTVDYCILETECFLLPTVRHWKSRSQKWSLKTCSPVGELKELYNYIPKLALCKVHLGQDF